LAKHYHHRPDGLSDQQVEEYIRHLIEQRHLATAGKIEGVRNLGI